MNKKILILISMSLCLNICFAESTNKTVSKALQLEEVVVTGTRTGKLLINSPVKVDVITQLEIQRKHARDLREIIDGTIGIDIQSIHGKTGYNVWLQGMDSDRVLVLIDGERISASTGSSVDLTQIPATGIERVEIVKGATSALYGSAAIGGVINVLTRKPKEKLRLDFHADGGSFLDKNPNEKKPTTASRHYSGHLSHIQDKFSLQVSANINDMDGLQEDPKAWSLHLPYGYKNTYSTKISYAWSNNVESTIHLSHYDENVSYRNTEYLPGVGNIYRTKKEKATRQRLTTGINIALNENTRTKIRFVYEDFQDATSQDLVSTYFVDQARYANVKTTMFNNHWQLYTASNHLLSTGIEYYQETAIQSAANDNDGTGLEYRSEFCSSGNERQSWDFYLQDDIKKGRWEWLPGLRYQHDNNFGNHLTPKLNGRFIIDEGTTEEFIRFGIGKGYRVPNLKERCFEFDHSHLGYMVLGNTKLVPEESLSLQFGWVYSDRKRYLIDINIFRNNVKKMIETVSSNARTIEVQQDRDIFLWLGVQEYTNIARALTQGIEISTSILINQNMHLFLGYQYLDAKNLKNHKRLKLRPQHQTDTSLIYESTSKNYDIGITLHWQSEEYYDENNLIKTPGWRNFNGKFNYYFSNNFSLYSGINNIEDKHKNYNDLTDTRNDRGRFVYMGFRISN